MNVVKKILAGLGVLVAAIIGMAALVVYGRRKVPDASKPEKALAEAADKAERESRAKILATDPDTIVADAGMEPRRDADVNTLAEGYSGRVLDRTRVRLSGLFGNSGVRRSPPGSGGGE
jgi:hypothetical protein